MNACKVFAILSVAVSTSIGMAGVVGIGDKFDKPTNNKSLNVSTGGAVVSPLVFSDKIFRELPESFVSRVNEIDDPELDYEMGLILESGKYGIRADVESAKLWFESAAKKGYAKAQYKVAMNSSELNYYEAQVDAFEGFKASAEQGYAPAQLELANMYLEGSVVDVDEAKAKYYYELAASQGLLDAELNLALMYQKGLGVEVDPKKAVYYYDSAANKGQPQAQFNLGIAYYFGYGVERDLWESKNWFHKAFLSGNADALVFLNKIHVL